ncbi:hypothetical protein TTHERM_01215000 (macronuclear) [Tetrahymena thermophila SB210]|uniref:Uncharacterized protein n=1 Tax=Tetrahymena thermophila (strain SB210) TaxID=312017 RepID=Q22VB4_TETTS|nr:hypothetical protein TTHERM_01215000 [Tetrahymena thermophila SB210]EAR89205.2 hypothetical protein TTHERM_01215000 [Tetrahymena thermophila SB210]|eukprot:XP_001009450.2 hypothetical protein TTHERM_01215000 [Tetrahymena thermophila SB210]
MQQIQKKESSEYLKFSYSKGKYTLQEIIIAKDIDFYSIANTQLLQDLNNNKIDISQKDIFELDQKDGIKSFIKLTNQVLYALNQILAEKENLLRKQKIKDNYVVVDQSLNDSDSDINIDQLSSSSNLLGNLNNYPEQLNQTSNQKVICNIYPKQITQNNNLNSNCLQFFKESNLKEHFQSPSQQLMQLNDLNKETFQLNQSRNLTFDLNNSSQQLNQSYNLDNSFQQLSQPCNIECGLNNQAQQIPQLSNLNNNQCNFPQQTTTQYIGFDNDSLKPSTQINSQKHFLDHPQQLVQSNNLNKESFQLNQQKDLTFDLNNNSQQLTQTNNSQNNLKQLPQPCNIECGLNNQPQQLPQLSNLNNNQCNLPKWVTCKSSFDKDSLKPSPQINSQKHFQDYPQQLVQSSNLNKELFQLNQQSNVAFDLNNKSLLLTQSNNFNNSLLQFTTTKPYNIESDIKSQPQQLPELSNLNRTNYFYPQQTTQYNNLHDNSLKLLQQNSQQQLTQSNNLNKESFQPYQSTDLTFDFNSNISQFPQSNYFNNSHLQLSQTSNLPGNLSNQPQYLPQPINLDRNQFNYLQQTTQYNNFYKQSLNLQQESNLINNFQNDPQQSSQFTNFNCHSKQLSQQTQLSNLENVTQIENFQNKNLYKDFSNDSQQTNQQNIIKSELQQPTQSINKEVKQIKEERKKEISFQEELNKYICIGEMSNQKNKNLELLITLKESYEDLILKNFQEEDYQVIIKNPFKIKFNQLKNIYLDTLTADIQIVQYCNDSYSVDYSDIESFKQLIDQQTTIQIFELFIILKQIQLDDCKCECFHHHLDQYRFPSLYEINLNEYFSSKVKNIEVEIEDYLYSKTSLKLDYEKYDFKIYLGSESSEEIQKLILINKDMDEIDLEVNGIQIPNILNKKQLFVNKKYQIIVEQQDQCLLRIAIFYKFQIQDLLSLNLQKIIVDLFYD